ncbi:MAG: tetratricopeptide repeat protein [Pseudomonadota bacterium]
MFARLPITFTFLSVLLWHPQTAVAANCTSASTRLLTPYAEAGDAEAQFTLSQSLSGLECDDAELATAMFWLDRAAQSGHPEAAFYFGIRLILGEDVLQDQPRGFQFLTTAAEAGLVESQHHLGLLLLEASETEAMKEEGFYWLGAATAQGDVISAITISQVYKYGLHGVPKNQCLAFDWLETARLLAVDAAQDVPPPIPAVGGC